MNIVLYLLFVYGNSTDPEPKNNLFKNINTYIIRPYDYAIIGKNIFCYFLINVQKNEIP